MSEKTLYAPQTLIEEDWQLIVAALRNCSDSRSQELAELLLNWRSEIPAAWHRFEGVKMALHSK
jgi:hypothetical protein